MTQLRRAGQPPATGTPLLEARNLTKHFDVHGAARRRSGRRALPRLRRPAGGARGAAGGETGPVVVHAVEDVSLALAEGQITAVVGESGSGKSTLARLLARLIKPTSGELLLGGRPVPPGRRDARGYARQVQMVLQDPFSSLNPVHDVRYHLARPLRVHGLPTPGLSLDETIISLLERVALTPADQFTGKYPHELSGGQRQRVAIARALAVRPRVLLADEPVSMLDVSIRLGILNLLGDLRDTERLAILYITHDIASARYLADTIAVMYAGQVVEAGPAQAVTDEPAHPYTQLLLGAAPDPDRAEEAPGTSASRASRAGRRGTPPSLLVPPPGCRFHPRCPHAMAICTEAEPRDFEVAGGHLSACWRHSRDLDDAQAAPLHQLTPHRSAPSTPLAPHHPHPTREET
ncbi:MAG TPA: ABC transporter ATP-binding protein [Streptosporangiaceae bacterium]